MSQASSKFVLVPFFELCSCNGCSPVICSCHSAYLALNVLSFILNSLVLPLLVLSCSKHFSPRSSNVNSNLRPPRFDALEISAAIFLFQPLYKLLLLRKPCLAFRNRQKRSPSSGVPGSGSAVPVSSSAGVFLPLLVEERRSRVRSDRFHLKLKI